MGKKGTGLIIGLLSALAGALGISNLVERKKRKRDAKKYREDLRRKEVRIEKAEKNCKNMYDKNKILVNELKKYNNN